jgi:uncharacterized protein (DUF885 family)
VSFVNDLAARYWDYWKQTNALFNLQRGYHEYGDRMEDISASGVAGRRRALQAFAAEAEDATPASLDEAVTMAVVAHTATSRRGWLGWREELYLPNHTMGVHTILFNSLPRQAYLTAEHAEKAIARHHAIAPMIDQLIERLHHAAARGVTPHFHTVGQTISQVDTYLATDMSHDRLLTVADPAQLNGAAATGWRQHLAAAIETSIRPAFGRYRDALETVVLPAARPDDQPGLSYIAGGEEHYAERVQAHTTLDRTPRTIHEIGIDLVAQLDDEYRTIGGSALGTTDLQEIYRRLREDPSLRCTSGAAIVADAERAVTRVTSSLAPAFNRLPQAPCVVRETDVGAAAFYQVPASDGSRPGIFFINTADPGAWGTFEIEGLSFHEAVPGHHFERSLALERTGVPEVRHGAPITVFSEGWALYAERLADEMELYSSDLDRLGMLANDSLRATRLVVDTGLHSLGWSRRRAIDYMVANSPITPGRAADEVDRYLGLAGQALSYMTGRLEIMDLRRKAAQALGDRFDIRAFHEAVLEYGSTPLPTLRLIVDEWVARA